jgi:hypothetical protein
MIEASLAVQKIRIRQIPPTADFAAGGRHSLRLSTAQPQEGLMTQGRTVSESAHEAIPAT